MTSPNRSFQPSRLSVCVALAFPFWSGAAIAQSTFEANGSYSVGSDKTQFGGPTSPKSDVLQLPESAGSTYVAISTTPTVRWDDPSAALSAGSLGDGHFFGSTSTSELYGSQALMSTSLQLVYRDQITNTSGVAQQASFALDISKLIFSYDYGEHERGTNLVTFAAAVYLDNNTQPLWATSFSYEDGARQLSVSGAEIGLTNALADAVANDCTDPPGYGYGSGCTFRSGTFGIADYQTTLALGTIGIGDTVGIRYEVSMSTETDMYGGGAGVSFSDPSGLNSNGRLAFDAPGGSVAAVPEPETYAMMAAGLGVLAVARRRRGR